MLRLGLATALLAGTIAGSAFAVPAPDPGAASGKAALRSPEFQQVARARQRTRVPVVPIIPDNPSLTLSKPPKPLRQPSTGPETYSDRVLRCTHYGGSMGVTQGQMGSFVHSCALH